MFFARKVDTYWDETQQAHQEGDLLLVFRSYMDRKQWLEKNPQGQPLNIWEMSKLELKGSWMADEPFVLKAVIQQSYARLKTFLQSDDPNNSFKKRKKETGRLELLESDLYFDLQLLSWEKAPEIYQRLVQRKETADTTETEKALLRALKRTYKQSGRWAAYLDHSRREDGQIMILDGNRIAMQPDHPRKTIDLEDYTQFWRDMLALLKEVIYPPGEGPRKETDALDSRSDYSVGLWLQELSFNLQESIRNEKDNTPPYTQLILDTDIIHAIKELDKSQEYHLKTKLPTYGTWLHWLNMFHNPYKANAFGDKHLKVSLKNKDIKEITSFLMEQYQILQNIIQNEYTDIIEDNFIKNSVRDVLLDDMDLIDCLIKKIINARDSKKLECDLSQMPTNALNALSKFTLKEPNGIAFKDDVIKLVHQIKQLRELGENLTEPLINPTISNHQEETKPQKRNRGLRI